MSEWKRNKRRTSGFPKGVWHGMTIEARQRDGQVFTGVVGEHEWLQQIHFDTSDGCEADIMAYRIVSEPAAAPATTPPDHSKGFPVGTTAKDIGAKVGDEFVVVDSVGGFENGAIIKLKLDDNSEFPYFTDGEQEHCMYWSELAPIQPKTAIELQSEEVGIPEPVRLVNDDNHLGIKRPDGDGWVKYNAGDVVDLDGVVSIDWANAGGDERTSHAPNCLMWNDGDAVYQIAWYRLNYGDASQHYISKQQAAEADKRIDDAAQGVREAFGRKLATTKPVTAGEFLQSALNTLTQRGKDYDKPEGERSAAAVAVAFNAITGKDLSAAEVYLVLQLVKDVRQWQCADYHADSALDCVAYAALKAESLAASSK